MMTLNIVGAGRVASTLACLWTARNVFKVLDIVNRSTDSAAVAAAFIGAGEPCASLSQMRPIGCAAGGGAR